MIADQVRMRRDLQPLRVSDPLTAELRPLARHREDVTAARVRTINWLRAQLLEYFPALERAFDFSGSRGALVLLSAFRTPEKIRTLGLSRQASFLTVQQVRNADRVAARAIEAAVSQPTSVPGEAVAADMVRRLARWLGALDAELAELDQQITDRFNRHPQGPLVASLPGMGPVLGTDLLVACGGDVLAFDSADRLAGVAGLAPTPRDSGQVSGNVRRRRRYNRRLQRALCLSARIAMMTNPVSRAYYLRKRAERKRHTQALLALARRRLNVLWVVVRDERPYESRPSTA